MPKCLRCGGVGGHHAAGCPDAPKYLRLVVIGDTPRSLTPDEIDWLHRGEQPPAAVQDAGEAAADEYNAAEGAAWGPGIMEQGEGGGA